MVQMIAALVVQDSVVVEMLMYAVSGPFCSDLRKAAEQAMDETSIVRAKPVSYNVGYLNHFPRANFCLYR